MGLLSGSSKNLASGKSGLKSFSGHLPLVSDLNTVVVHQFVLLVVLVFLRICANEETGDGWMNVESARVLYPIYTWP